MTEAQEGGGLAFWLFVLPLAIVAGALAFSRPRWPRGCSSEKAPTDVRCLALACEEFEELHGRYPLELEELCRPDADGRTFLKGRKPPRDPWKREYDFVPPGERTPDLLVYTLGRDGELGGAGWDQDVSNHGRGDEARIRERPRTMR